MQYFKLQSGTIIETDTPEIWEKDAGAVRLSAAKGKKAMHDEALEYLRSILKAGDTVYTKVTHVSRSGMSRNIQAYVIRDNEPQNISGYVGRVLESPVEERRELAVKVGGCGMDMGFHLVHNLSYKVCGEYACIGDKCPSPDHHNSGECRKNKTHKDGYGLRHRWM